jgi:hypothetical protein
MEASGVLDRSEPAEQSPQLVAHVSLPLNGHDGRRSRDRRPLRSLHQKDERCPHQHVARSLRRSVRGGGNGRGSRRPPRFRKFLSHDRRAGRTVEAHLSTRHPSEQATHAKRPLACCARPVRMTFGSGARKPHVPSHYKLYGDPPACPCCTQNMKPASITPRG